MHDPEALKLLVQYVQSDQSAAASELLRHVSARFDERPTHYSYSNSDELLERDEHVVAEINAILGEAGLAQITSRTAARQVARVQEVVAQAKATLMSEAVSALVIEDFGDGAASVARLLRRLGTLRFYGEDLRGPEAARLVNALGFRLVSMAAVGQRYDVELALHVLADEIRFHSEQPIFVQLAEGLERYGERRLAAIAYTLTWTRSRGQGGWLTFGGNTQLACLGRAMTLDRDAALDVVSLELERVVAEGQGSLGVTQALIYAFTQLEMGDFEIDGLLRRSHDIAFGIWESAADVITSRTPRLSDHDDPPGPLVPTGADTTEKIENALCLALVAGLGHPSREQKRRALIAISLIIKLRPDRIQAALITALTTLSDPSTLYWLLWVVRQHAAQAHLVHALQGTLQLLCASEFLAVRSIAREILTSVDPAQAAAIHLPIGDALLALVNLRAHVRSNTARHTREVAGDRIQAAIVELPGFLECIATAVESREEEMRERGLAQRRALMHTTDEDLPDAFLVTIEVVEAELQRVAGRGRVSLAADGRIVPDPLGWEANVAGRLANTPELALMLERTREPRPNVPAAPSTGAKGTLFTASAAKTATVVAGPYDGFRAIASMEYRHPGHRQQTDSFSIRCIALELGAVPDFDSCPPITRVSVTQWFTPSPMTTAIDGPLVGCDEGDDVPGMKGLGLQRPILTPVPWLPSVLGLMPSSSQLLFFDVSGAAIAVRTWRAEYEVDDYRLTHPMLVGAQVLLREDLFQKFLSICGNRLALRDYVVIAESGD
jgi:hypothetical protein